jgi:putative acetyltransferase
MKSPDGFILRHATNADIPEIKDLIFSILRDYGLSPDPGSTDNDLSDIEKYYLNNGGVFDVLIEIETQQIVGTVGLWHIDVENVELRKMYLDKNCRGKGLGRFLLEHAIADAKQLCFRRMTLETASILKEAVALYARYGFKIRQSDHLAARCDMAMELEL